MDRNAELIFTGDELLRGDIVNTNQPASVMKEKLHLNGRKLFVIDASKIARETIGRDIPNTPMLGALVRVTGLLSYETVMDDTRKKIEQKYLDLSAEGLRVLGVASKKLKEEKAVYSINDESDMTFVGFVAFLDPPKESAAEAITKLVDDVKRLGPLHWPENWQEDGGRLEAIEGMLKEHEEAMEVPA